LRVPRQRAAKGDRIALVVRIHETTGWRRLAGTPPSRRR
jgi:hypothetical protein